MKNILVTICARAGSKGVASKNTRDFLGYPICYYTLSALGLFIERHGARYGRFDIAVNTDSDDLIRQMDKTGFEYIRAIRRDDLAGDRASKIDVIRDTLAQAEQTTGKDYSIVLDMDLTSPLRRADDVKNVIEKLENTGGAEVALSVTEARRNPYFNQLCKDADGYYRTVIKSNYVARQQAPEIFDANASLYAYDAGFLRTEDTIITQAKLAVSIMKDTAVLDIDSEQDYELMQVLAEYFYKKDILFGEIRDNIKRFIRPL